MSKPLLLLIEDNDPARFLLFNYLSGDYKVWSCRHAVDADSWLKAGNMPDLILLDWNLPLVSGSFFLEKLRSSGLYSKVPVLVFSSDLEKDIVHHFDGFLQVDFLQKPYDLDVLDAKMDQLLATSSNAL